MSDNQHTVKYLEKPWGFHAVLSDAGHYKVKELVVHPGKRLSLQMHHHRSEHWTCLEGTPTVTVDDDVVVLEPGDTQVVPAGAVHRIENNTDATCVILEVQFLEGDVLDEEDIVRFEDDFGRHSGFVDQETFDILTNDGPVI